jgi:methylenetetrahydrofolate dehydrogenase (NADP+)/methenyltetrahydrofolate cyclohydrolase
MTNHESSSPDSPRILDGKAFAALIRADVAQNVEQLVGDGGRQPKLVAVLVGENPGSKAYVRSKTKGCDEAGLAGETLRLDADVDQDTLAQHIRRLNDDDTVDGILVQLPLPGHLVERQILNLVAPEKDVDGFHPINVGRLWLGETALVPATPSGVLEMLHRAEIPLQGKSAVIVGRSNIVGKPMASLLLREHCTVTLCHSRTRDLAAVCRGADILVAAIGRTAMIGPEHVKEGAVVIDVGMNRVDDAAEVERLFPGDEKRRTRFEKRGYILTGDVDFTRVLPKVSAITPVPGGVGPLTVAQVISNTLLASKRRQGNEE